MARTLEVANRKFAQRTCREHSGLSGKVSWDPGIQGLSLGSGEIYFLSAMGRGFSLNRHVPFQAYQELAGSAARGTIEDRTKLIFKILAPTGNSTIKVIHFLSHFTCISGNFMSFSCHFPVIFLSFTGVLFAWTDPRFY